MGEPKFKTDETVSLPGSTPLSASLLADESELVKGLIERARVGEDEQHEIARLAERLVRAARAGRRESGGVEIVSGEILEGAESIDIPSPHDRRIVVGTCRNADPPAIDRALTAARSASHDWDAIGGEARAVILDRAAELFEADRAALMGLMVREAGKTLADAQGDLREAVDHLCYAAAEARRSFAAPLELRGPTG